MHVKLNFNLNWLFAPKFSPAYVAGPFSPEEFEEIHLPHTVKELPYNCFSQDDTAMCATYVKHFTVPKEYSGKRAILEFEGVMTHLELYINGERAGEHSGGYSRSRFDITPHLKEQNTIVVMVDSHELADIPPFGYTIDFLTFGGIYRNVSLYFTEECYIGDALFRYDLCGTDAVLYPELILENHGQSGEGEVIVELFDDQGGCQKRYTQSISLIAGESCVVTHKEPVSGIHLWDIEDPYLYTAVITLKQKGEVQDVQHLKTGFRTVACKPEGFFLNGRHVKLVGLDRHQSYPYLGYAMPERGQEKDADILKNYLHVNTVRTSHYMQSAAFLGKCDELGLLVFAEIPGWGHIGGEAFQENALRDVRDMITTEYNHPSIFIWSIRINESDDDDAFYTRTHQLAKSLDPSRATTGTRCIKNSNLIEDVYTYNDFVHYTHNVKNYREVVLLNQQSVTGLPYKVPYLVSEYAGHVFPLKPFDSEEKKMRHVQIHAAVQHANMLRRDAMGAIGWCAFDYNTHGDYGSGDKICYHGVMDMFRIPKYAAEVYRSQVDPTVEVVLEPATLFARGENDDNRPIPFAVLTNCDYIEVMAYNKIIGKFFPSLSYGALAHPPIIVDNDPGRWQDIWDGGAIIGYLGGQEVARKTYARDAYLSTLMVSADDTELFSTTVDATRFVCRYLDQEGNLLPYYNGIVEVSLSGDIELVGPATMAVVGGAIGFWVKSKPTGMNSQASVTIKAVNTLIPDQIFSLQLCRDEEVTTL